MRISTRRFTRLTNAFSKRLENQCAAVALYFMWSQAGPCIETLPVTSGDGRWHRGSRLERRRNRRLAWIMGESMADRKGKQAAGDVILTPLPGGY